MTLIEILVVIAIIGILVGILLPVIAKVKEKARIAQAKKEIKDIELAIQNFKADYGLMPLSPSARTAGVPDFTFGTYNLGYSGGSNVLNPGAGYQANNSELIAILTDDTTVLSVNAGHQANTKKKQFLQVKYADANGMSGVGPTDLVYRDPWKNPYIITVDADYDNVTKDAFYRLNSVSKQPSSIAGFNSLVSNSGTATNDYVFRGQVMVWSFGPDGAADSGLKADDGVNKDNIYSW